MSQHKAKLDYMEIILHRQKISRFGFSFLAIHCIIKSNWNNVISWVFKLCPSHLLALAQESAKDLRLFDV